VDNSLINYDNIVSIGISKGYKFSNVPYMVDIIGIRSKEPIVNKFCDKFLFTRINGNNIREFYICDGTTDPGLYYLQNPMNVKGTAIVKEGQYIDLWGIGTHTGYEALVQIGNVTVYRDKDKDGELDLDPNNLDTSKYFGIDLHHARFDGKSTDINRWSAGCMVIADINDFAKILSWCKEQVSNKLPNKFTYTLINEKDLMA